MRQDEIAAELGVTTRTLRNWKSAPAFQRELERQRMRATRQPASTAAGERKPRPKREPASRPDRARKTDPATGRQPEPAPAAATSEPAIEVDDGVPIFPDTTEGRTARLAYYETRKLNKPPLLGVRLHRRETRRTASTRAPRAPTSRQPSPTIRTGSLSELLAQAERVRC